MKYRVLIEQDEDGIFVAEAYFAVYELGRGFTAMIIYVLMRAFVGAGPKTACWRESSAGLHSH